MLFVDVILFFCFKQKTAYELRISDWSSDVCASDLMYLNTQQDADELYAANDGEFFRKFFLPTHPELDEVWSRMKDPRALHAMLNWDRANPVAKMYLAAIKEGVDIRQDRKSVG